MMERAICIFALKKINGQLETLNEDNMGFDDLCKILRPIVMDNAPPNCSVGKAREIVEDCVYLISHGYTMEMTNENKKQKDKALDSTLETLAKSRSNIKREAI
jgi:hypothetical protein